MRPIKFRAFDRETEKFIYSDKDYADNGESWFEFKDGELKAFALHGMNACSIDEPLQSTCDELGPPQQFTGLLDKQGEKIFEGDIVQVDDMGDFYIAKIIFEKGCFLYESDSPYWHLESIETPMTEIIGNIYQNPGLLE